MPNIELIIKNKFSIITTHSINRLHNNRLIIENTNCKFHSILFSTYYIMYLCIIKIKYI